MGLSFIGWPLWDGPVLDGPLWDGRLRDGPWSHRGFLIDSLHI